LPQYEKICMKYRISIRPHLQIARQLPDGDVQPPLDTGVLMQLLDHIQAGGSIASACRTASLSYRHVWGLLRTAEAVFGGALLIKQRGTGTQLTPLAATLLRAQQRIDARLAPMLSSLSSELETELARAVANGTQALRLYASHGFAVEALVERLQAGDFPLELRFRNSAEAVAALAHRECDLAGFHVPLGQFEDQALRYYRQWLDPRRHWLIQLATRNQGLFVAPGNPKGIVSLEDLARSDVRFVNRQPGSGTRMLLELMLKGAKVAASRITGFDTTEFTHAAVAAYIASGMADAGFGVQTAAHKFNLGFVPLARERYFFAIERRALESTLMGDVLTLLASPAFRRTINGLAGYDGALSGQILSLEEAFPGHP
jgi:molybdate transport repressor ModE-like protein